MQFRRFRTGAKRGREACGVKCRATGWRGPDGRRAALAGLLALLTLTLTAAWPAAAHVPPADVLRPCPQEKIARLLDAATTPGEISAALAKERELMRLCVERQSLALEVMKLERQMMEALPPPVEIPEPVVRVVERVVEKIVEAETDQRAAPPPVKLDETRLTYFSVYGTARKPKAGITLADGAELFVKPGDEIPGIGKVEGISVNPAEVRVTGAATSPLPYRKRGSGGK